MNGVKLVGAVGCRFGLRPQKAQQPSSASPAVSLSYEGHGDPEEGTEDIQTLVERESAEVVQGGEEALLARNKTGGPPGSLQTHVGHVENPLLLLSGGCAVSTGYTHVSSQALTHHFPCTIPPILTILLDRECRVPFLQKGRLRLREGE